MDPIASPSDHTLISDVRRVGADDRAYRHAARRGEYVRLHRGAYLPAATWEALSPEEQYCARAIAAADSSRARVVLSHETAAVLWGIPRIRALPSTIHVLAAKAGGSRTEGVFRRHAVADLTTGVVQRQGCLATSALRTLVEYCAVVPFADAVVALDWALRRKEQGLMASPALVVMMTEGIATVRKRPRVLRALEFADPLSESPGESLSRVVLHQLGFPAPILQQRFDDRKGVIGRADFWWPEHGVIGEFDGAVKYSESRYTGGRLPKEVLMAEKRRENRLRALGPKVARWDWQAATHPAELRALLAEAGLPLERGRDRR